MNEAKFQVGEYVNITDFRLADPTYVGTNAKVLAVRTNSKHIYKLVLHDGRVCEFFEDMLRKLPVGTKVQVTAEATFTGRAVPLEDNIGLVEDVGTDLYGVRSIRTSKYYGVSPTEVQPVLTTQTSSTTQEETTMEEQVNVLPVGAKVRATQDVTGNSGRVRWLQGAVGQVTESGKSVRCTDDWYAVPEAQRQYWEVVSDDTPLTVCKPEPKPEPEPPKDEPETLVGKRVKLRKSSVYFDEQGYNIIGKRRKGIVIVALSGGTWVNVRFDDGYYNGYPITDLKIIKDKPKAPEFVPEAVTKDTPVGTKVRIVRSYEPKMLTGAVGTLARHDNDDNPRVDFSNDFWYPNYRDLETVHPDTAITKDNGDAAL